MAMNFHNILCRVTSWPPHKKNQYLINSFFLITNKPILNSMSWKLIEINGNALSIAKNLTNLMGGEFAIHTDGDLFVAEITFSTIIKK